MIVKICVYAGALKIGYATKYEALTCLVLNHFENTFIHRT